MNRPYAPDAYYEKLYAARPAPFSDVTKENWRQKTETVRESVQKILGKETVPLKKDPIAVRPEKTGQRNGYRVETLSVEICEGLTMLCYVLIPDEKRSETGVAAVCGHGYGCRQILRQSESGRKRIFNFFDNYQKNFAEALALEGHTVIVPEPVGFGKARLKKDSLKPFYASSCETVSGHSLLYGFSTAALRVWQVRCCIDLLLTRYGCRKAGCMGISGGGLVTLFASLTDERIEKTAVCGYVNTFGTSVLAMWHCPDNYIPGLLTVGDMYDFASALAPKKLLIECGKKDRLFPIRGSSEAIENIKRVYEKAGVPENFTPVVFDGKHEVSLPQALQFFRDI